MFWVITASTKDIIGLQHAYAHFHVHWAGLRMNSGKVFPSEDATKQIVFFHLLSFQCLLCVRHWNNHPFSLQPESNIKVNGLIIKLFPFTINWLFSYILMECQGILNMPSYVYLANMVARNKLITSPLSK